MRAYLIFSTVILFLVVFSVAQRTSAVSVPPVNEDKFQYLPLEHSDILHVMGVEVWKIRVPSEQLKTCGAVHLEVLMPDGTSKKLTGQLNPARNVNDYLDVTVVVQFDDIQYTNCKRINLALLSKEFSARSIIGRPMEKITGYGQPNNQGDLREGLVLATLTATNANSGLVEATTAISLRAK